MAKDPAPDSVGFGLQLARNDLGRRQAEWGVRADAAPAGSPLVAALDRAAHRKATSIREGPYIRDEVFKCPVKAEQARWDLTWQIIERVNPGPWEGKYSEVL